MLFDQSSYQQPYVLKGARGLPAASAARGWGGDPARIVEIPNTYAFAQQHNMRLPAGLIAHRPAGASPHANKVGAFRFENFDASTKRNVPGLIVVMSVEEQEGAEVIFLTVLGGRGGWRFLRPKLSGDTLEYVAASGARFVFKWSDASGGSMTAYPPSTAMRGMPNTSKFVRLDG